MLATVLRYALPALKQREMKNEVRTVSIPEWQVRATVPGAHDRIPLRRRGVHAQLYIGSVATSYHALKEGTVMSLAAPVLSALNVQPQSSNLGARRVEVFNGAFHLASRISAMEARETAKTNVHVSEETQEREPRQRQEL